MRNPIILLKAASKEEIALAENYALASSRNYKAEVMKLLEALAFNQPVAIPFFKNITTKAVPFLEVMCATYNLTIYYQCTEKQPSVRNVKKHQVESLAQDLLKIIDATEQDSV